MDLFINSALTFEKLSSEATLPEDPNAWPNEILQELFKQVPTVADFAPHVVMDKVDGERGYGFGHIEISNKSELQHGATEESSEAAGVRQVRIPVVINNRKLQPFDILITDDDKMLPLTEERLRQAIFRPSAFDITARTPGDMSMIGQLYPPYRQNSGFSGGGSVQSAGMGKMGSDWGNPIKPPKDVGTWKTVTAPHFPEGHEMLLHPSIADEFLEAKSKNNYKKLNELQDKHSGSKILVGVKKGYEHKTKTSSLLSAILPTINLTDHTAFTETLSDTTLQAALVKNAGAVLDSLRVIAECVPVSTSKTAASLLNVANRFSTIVQVSADTDGYAVKTANHKFWMPTTEVWDRGEVVRTFGEKLALDTDMNGAVTVAPEPGVVAEPEKDQYELVKDFGIYKVKTEDGKEIIGYVFPNLLDTDGTPLPLSLFTNGSQAAVQGEIAGINVGGGASLFEGHPRGEGVFYELLSNGRAQATIPLTIQASMVGPDDGGVALQATTFDGRQVQVKIQPNISKVVCEGESLLVPENMNWLPLDTADEVTIVGDPTAANAETKMASKHHERHVYVRSGGHDSFSLSGMPIDKLASTEKSFLSFDEALFVLGALGSDLTYASTKLAESTNCLRPVEVAVKYEITLPSERIEEATKTASTKLAKIPNLRKSLIKEAAVIPDPIAVDTVLSLGFINPENVMTFVSYLPNLDEAQKKMCELLIASRLGLKDIPTSALERAIRSLEDVISGLKVLALQKN